MVEYTGRKEERYLTKHWGGRGSRLVLLVVLVVLFLTACGKKDSSGAEDSRERMSQEQEAEMVDLGWQAQYDLGIRLLGEGKYEEAIIAFSAVIDIDAKHAGAYLGRAEAYLAMGDMQENLVLAQADLNRISELDSAAWEETENSGKLADMYETLAGLYAGQGDWKAARDVLQQEYELLGDLVWAMPGGFQEKTEELGLILWQDMETGAGILLPDFEKFNVLMGVSGDSATDYYYLTEGQREVVLRPVLEKAQLWCDYGSQEVGGTYDQALAIMANACYRLGELERVKELRTLLYQRTGEERYNPAGYEEDMGDGSGTYYSAYGLIERLVYADGSESVWEYDGSGKPVKMTESSGDWFEFTYEEGQLKEEVRYDLEEGARLQSRVTFTYEGNSVSMVTCVYLDGVTELRRYTTTFQLDALGNPMWETRQDE